MGQNGIYESSQMKDVFAVASKYAMYNTTIVIEGETGVGKEVVASLIHQKSSRKNMPFQKINCASIPETLLESELFGYESGAFTGASTKGNPGLFESAHKGTLLLDEISELHPLTQVKLLRVLQEREVRRIGGSWSKSVDVRIIACTNVNLRKLVHAGEFRQDLYYRLYVAPIFIPPLRERKDDIAPLVESFLQAFNLDYQLNRTISDEAMKVLHEHSYPGNVRELRNIVEVAYINCTTNVIRQSDLPNLSATIVHTMPRKDIIAADETLESLLSSYERDIILEALKQSRSIRKAAQLLGISNSTLLRRIKQYDLENLFEESGSISK